MKLSPISYTFDVSRYTVAAHADGRATLWRDGGPAHNGATFCGVYPDTGYAQRSAGRRMTLEAHDARRVSRAANLMARASLREQIGARLATLEAEGERRAREMAQNQHAAWLAYSPPRGA